MALAAGTRIGPYEVGAPLGAGGMGEVYRARDTKLGRDVAIKVLAAEFAYDRERVARFQREAQLLASLNHPHIATIHGLEEVEGAQFLVMELVEGGTLADLLQRRAGPSGPAGLEFDEALKIARQVADALQAAHEKGIVHRDLKPANIGFTATGQVKVLDFGLAKAVGSGEGSPIDSPTLMTHSPTLSVAATQAGMILGTAAYMAPEQARGKAADKRSDIWAFGCVLYEMLTGKRPFEGVDIADTLAAVLRSEPDWTVLPAATAAPIQALVRGCLRKDPLARLGDIAAALFVLDEMPQSGSTTAWSANENRADPAYVRTTRRRMALAAIAALVLGGIVAGAAVWYVTRSVPAELPEMRLQIETPLRATGLGDLTEFALSPDGRTVIFRGPARGARRQLWVRPLASETAQPLMGTEDGARPFWSPDGRAIAFVANGQLKRLELADGRIQTLATPAVPAGGAWNTDGTILFPRTYTSPLLRVAATGGEVTEITRIDPARHSGHVYPQFLPDGRHFLFFAFGSREGKGGYIGSLDSMEARQLVRTDAAPVFAPPDLVLYAQEGALVARRLDLRTWELTGEPMTVARQVTVDLFNGTAAVAASPAGPIAYRSASVERQLVWLDRTGQRVSTIGDTDAVLGGVVGGVGRQAPDGRTIALPRTVDGNTDIWLMDTSRATLRRFTIDPRADITPVWSPDGTRIVFGSNRRAGNFDLYEKPSDGGEAEKLLLESSEDEFANDWSPDGRFILYGSTGPETRRDVWALPLFGDRKPLPIARTPANEEFPRFSPDGRWIAFTSDESGRNEVYVQPFPGPGPKSQISTEGGQVPQWRGDGREIFYGSIDESRVMAVPVTLSDVVEAGIAVALFTKPEGFFAAAPDGQRFLVAPTADRAYPITILLNWSGARR